MFDRDPDPETATGHVVCLGEALALVGPDSGLDEAGTPLPGAATLGGAEANVAVALAAAGIRSSWVGRLGTDPLGAELADALRTRGVDVSAVEYDDERPTGYYSKLVHREPAAEPRTEMRYRRTGSAASAMGPEFIGRPAVAAVLASADVVHTSGITASLSPSCAALMRELLGRPRSGQLVAFDVNWREQLWPSGDPAEVVWLAAAADLVLVGADEARRVFGTDDPAGLRAMLPGPLQLVIKDGDVRALGVDRAGGVVEVSALTVEVVEPVGAGDAFAAGYVTGVLRGESMTRSLRRGHLSAARVLTVHSDSAAPFPADILDPVLASSEQEWRRTAVGPAGIVRPGTRV